MLCSNAVIKITLSTIQQLGNVRNAQNLLYIHMYIEKNHKKLVHIAVSTCSCDCYDSPALLDIV